MSSDSENKQLQQLANTFYETLTTNKFFPSVTKSASALEELAGQMVDLNKNLEAANKSSTALSKSLNWLTLAAVVIAFFALGLQAVELFCVTPST